MFDNYNLFGKYCLLIKLFKITLFNTILIFFRQNNFLYTMELFLKKFSCEN